MFDKVTAKFEHLSRPLLMYKTGGKYHGLPFRQVRASVEQFARGLSAIGVKRGDMIGIISENRPEWVVADMGMMSLGAVSVPLYPTMTPKQIEFVYNDAGVKYAIVSNQLQLAKLLKILNAVKSLKMIIVMNEKGILEDACVLTFATVLKRGECRDSNGESVFHEAVQAIRPDDLLTLIYTSGTTGHPKGVMLTHDNMASNIRCSIPCLSISQDDTLLSFLPLCHSFERMAGYYTAISCGATIAYAESIDTVRENLLEIRPTVVTTVPRLFERIYHRIQKQVEAQSPLKRKLFHWAIDVGKRRALARRSGKFSPLIALQYALADRLVNGRLRARMGGRIRFFISGGAALIREYGEFFEAIGLQIIEGYGLSETSPVISVNRMDEHKFGTVGKPIPGVEVKIASDGEILARGPNIMKGYWNDPASTRDAIDEAGWFHTGDIGIFDEEGFLRITDRKKHLFKTSGGKYISPQQIENVLLQSKYVDQIVVIGEGKPHLVALVIPEFDMIREFARQSHMQYDTHDHLVQEEEIRKLFEVEFAKLQIDLPTYERVRKFTILGSPLTIEGGEVTPTMKVKRKVVEEKYRQLIEKMYDSDV